MNVFEKMIATVSPQRALRRARSRHAIAHYEAATVGRRSTGFAGKGSDADAAARHRSRMAFFSRDLTRNNPYGARAPQVISNNVVGDGIIPKLTNVPDDLKDEANKFVKRYLDSTAIDFHGRQNLYGLQRLAMNTVVDSGEVLIVQCDVTPTPANPYPLRLKVLEPDHLDVSMDLRVLAGGWIKEGIEYDAAGQRVAYYLFDEHPGSEGFQGSRWSATSRRVPANKVLHVYRQDRPGQMRGVTWFAPVALALQDLGDYQDAQIMRQKIAACFTAFRTLGRDSKADDEMDKTLSPGLIQDLEEGEEITFSNPPDVGGFDDFLRAILRSIAVGMGITYEALTGDLKNTNWTSMRMGRTEMNRNISAWQWIMLIPQMLMPMEYWIKQSWALARPDRARDIMAIDFQWVPPAQILVDPTKEIPATIKAIRGGLTSRQGEIRKLGYDPDDVMAEQAEDAKAAKELGLIFDSDAAQVSLSGVTQMESADPEEEDEDDEQ